MTTLDAILTHADRGESVATIAAALSVSPGFVYGVLRAHRPDRPRQPRTRTSKKRQLILGLLARGHQAPRVAFLAGCSAAYVYRLLGESVAVTNGDRQ
jgi:hypothetical protein